MSVNRKIARASLILITAAVCGYALSLAREIIVANYFGISRAMDAYCAALTYPTLINNVLLSAFGAVFIPVFIKCGLAGEEEAHRVASVAINVLLLVFFLGALVLFVFAPQIVALSFRGFTPDTAALAVRLLRIVCFTIVLTGATGAMSGILNAFEHFLWPAFSQLLVSGGTILLVVLCVRRWGIYSLALGLCAGLLAQCLVLVPAARRRGYRHYLDFNARRPAVREMLSLSLLFLVGIILSQVNIVVDRVMASYLAPGSIASLGYAAKMAHVPIMIFAGSLATAVFPFFSAQAARSDLGAMRDSLAKAMRVTAFIFIPLTVGIVMTARPLVALVFQRGAFGLRATDLTSAALACYAFQLFFYTTALILGRVFLALQEVAALVKVAVAGAVLNVVLNFLFMKIIDPPAAGIALSTSCVYAVAMCLCIRLLRKKADLLRGGHIMKGIAKVSASAAAMGIALYVLLSLTGGITVHSPFVSGVVRLGVSLGGACAVFLALAAALGIDEMGAAYRLLEGKMAAGFAGGGEG